MEAAGNKERCERSMFMFSPHRDGVNGINKYIRSMSVEGVG